MSDHNVPTNNSSDQKIITSSPTELLRSNSVWHKFIHNPEDIKRFGSVFEVSKKHLALCLYLTMRRKYYPSLSHGTTIVNRIAITGGNDFIKRLYQNILKLETPIGTYTDGDLIVPDEAFALYVMVDPKDTFRALAKVLDRCIEAITAGEEIPNAHSLYREEIPKSHALNVTKYKQIDLDTKDIDKVRTVDSLLTSLNIPIVISIETRGGFHLVYTNNTDKDSGRKLHEFKQTTSFQKKNVEGKMVTDHWFSVTNGPTVILPGTYQGGFPTRIISLKDWLNQ